VKHPTLHEQKALSSGHLLTAFCAKLREKKEKGAKSMAEYHPSLASVYKGWDIYQHHLVKAITPLSSDQLELRAAPHLRSIGENVTHIIGVRAGWLYYTLKEGDEDLVSIGADRPGQPIRSAAELVSGLEITWQVLQNALQRWTVADLEEEVRDINDNGEEEILTRQFVLWHLIEHDLHHGGELSFVLGMHGLTGIEI